MIISSAVAPSSVVSESLVTSFSPSLFPRQLQYPLCSMLFLSVFLEDLDFLLLNRFFVHSGFVYQSVLSLKLNAV